jgi:hypothetical protein
MFDYDVATNEIKEMGTVTDACQKGQIMCMHYDATGGILYAGLSTGLVAYWKFSIPAQICTFQSFLSMPRIPQNTSDSAVISIITISSLLLCAQRGGLVEGFNISASYAPCDPICSGQVKNLEISLCRN